MAKVSFRAKIQHVKYMDGTSAGSRIKVPVLHRGHCDMNAFRTHAKFGQFANSVMFESMLNKAAAAALGGYFCLDNVPGGVTVDTSGFLATVSFEL